MKKSMFIVSLLLAAGIVFAGSYEYLRVPAPGATTITSSGVSKVVLIEVAGSTEATGTVILKRVVLGTTTSNTQYTVTCSGGANVTGLVPTNTFYLAAGDTLIREGTATNGMVRLVLQ